MSTRKKEKINLSELIARFYGLRQAEVQGSQIYATDSAKYRKVWLERKGDKINRVWHENMSLGREHKVISVKEVKSSFKRLLNIVDDVNDLDSNEAFSMNDI